MRQIKGWRVWNIIFPVVVYFIASNLWMLALTTFIPYSNENYMILQTIGTLLTLPILIGIYRNDVVCCMIPEVRKEKIQALFTGQGMVQALLIILTAVCASIALNDLISMTGLLENSASYQQTADKFYSGKLFWEVAGTCVMAPLAEEVLYRGIVYQRLKCYQGRTFAVMISALIFGLMHMNLVQFLYAFLFGMLLAFFMEQTGHLYGAVLGHMAANLFSVFRTETGCLYNARASAAEQWFLIVITFALAAAGVAAMHTFHKKKL